MKSKFCIYVQNPSFDVFNQDYFKGLASETKEKMYFLSKHGIIESRQNKLFDVSYLPNTIEYQTLYLMDESNKEIAYILQKVEQSNQRVYQIPLEFTEMKCTEVRFKETFFDIVNRREVIQNKVFNRIFFELNCDMNDYVINELRKVLLLFHAP